MIITEPNDFVAEVHDRMPVLLEQRQFEPWLAGEAGLEYLKPPPNDFLQKWPVSKRVNSSRAEADDFTLMRRLNWQPPRPTGKCAPQANTIQQCRCSLRVFLPTASA